MHSPPALKGWRSLQRLLDPSHVSQYNQTVQLANTYYQNIAGISDTSDIYTQGILEYIQTSENIMTMFQELTNDIASNNQVKAAQDVSKFENESSSSGPDIYQLVSQWYKEKALPFENKQQVLHDDSWTLYKKAYLYAKDSKLTNILNVWGNNPPGTTVSGKPI